MQFKKPIEIDSFFNRKFSIAMTSKTILITGSTDGLGKATVEKLLKEGHTVVMTGRDPKKTASTVSWLESQGVNTEKLHKISLDLNSLESIRNAVEEFNALNLPLDVLINNAGVYLGKRQFSPDTNRVEKTIFVNFVGTLYFTLLLEPKLHEGSRVWFVTSSLHDPEVRGGGGKIIELELDNLDGSKEWDGSAFYRISKLAIMYATYLLAERLNSKNVLVGAFCPGFVPTTALNRESNVAVRFLMKRLLAGASFTTSEDQSSSDYVYYATSEDITETGKYFRDRKQANSSKASYDLKKGKQVWNVACDICKLDDMKYPTA
jgi:NAD(P)-dependent dehydrogenase (short-subunit alcohol dehydrogenase family)